MPVPPSFPTTTLSPVVGININLGGGVNSGQRQKKVLMVGVGDGVTKVAGDISEVFDGAEADSFYGPGYSLARMCRVGMEQARGMRIFGGVVADAGGTAAQATITFAAGPSTAACTYELTIHGWAVTTQIPAATGSAAAGPLLDAAIKAHPYYDQMPITSNAVGAVVTLTTKEQNVETTTQVTNMWHDDSNLSVLTAALDTAATAGATALDISAVLTAAEAELFDYYVIMPSDSTNGGRLETHLDTFVAPLQGFRQQGIMASMDTPGNINTLAVAVNAHLVQVIAYQLFQDQHFEVAARFGVERAYRESTDPATVYKNYPMQRCMIPHLPADYMLAAERETALHNGVTPVMVYNSEATIPRSITSRSQTAGGAPDTTVLDTSNVSIPFAMGDDLENDFETYFYKETGIGFKVMDNPTEGVLPPPFTATPNLVEERAKQWLWTWYERGWIQDPTDAEAEVSASIDAVDDTRINLSLPGYTIRGLYVLDVTIYQK